MARATSVRDIFTSKKSKVTIVLILAFALLILHSPEDVMAFFIGVFKGSFDGYLATNPLG